MRRRSRETHVRIHLALEKLADQRQRAVFDSMRDHAGYRHALQASRQFRQIIAHLVGVREEHDPGVEKTDVRRERQRVSVRRVVVQQLVLDCVHGLDVGRGQLVL